MSNIKPSQLNFEFKFSDHKKLNNLFIAKNDGNEPNIKILQNLNQI